MTETLTEIDILRDAKESIELSNLIIARKRDLEKQIKEAKEEIEKLEEYLKVQLNLNIKNLENLKTIYLIKA